MGLHVKGDNGVKAVLKARYGRAFRTFTTLGDMRKGIKGLERGNVVVALDGNVLMMQVPKEAASFAAYVGIVTNAIRSAMGTAKVVVVVFDEPAILSFAKKEEQVRRDTARTRTVPISSFDYKPYPTSDDFGAAELNKAPNCHDIVNCRAARSRFFDEVGCQVLSNLKKTMRTWEESGFGTSDVVFDGLDPRGAERPIGAVREPKIYGSSAEVAAMFEHPPEGEGDRKLALIEQRVREIAFVPESDRPAFLKTPKLHCTVTIDTDSIAIELLEKGRRSVENPNLSSCVKGVLCMRERQNKRDSWDDDPGAVYCCLDYDLLYEMIQKDMWGMYREPSTTDRRLAIALMVSGWALSGCDFTEVKGLNAKLIFDALPSFVKTAPKHLALMEHAWSGNREDIKAMVPALKRLVLLCAGNYSDQPRSRKATAQSLRDVGEGNALTPLLRAAWVTSYWSNNEQRGDLSDFGFYPLSSFNI
tara:strand:- start:9816 stop:11237 length:1422 start_codon:yes stop_codon:yes gene_type:complete